MLRRVLNLALIGLLGLTANALVCGNLFSTGRELSTAISESEARRAARKAAKERRKIFENELHGKIAVLGLHLRHCGGYYVFGQPLHSSGVWARD